MKKPFDPARLFLRRKPLPSLAYAVGTALDAISAGKQRMATFITSLAEMRDPKAMLFAIMDVAFDRGFVVVLFQIEADVHVFIGRDEELWRVPALIAAHETGMVDGCWSLSAEVRVGKLLGLSNAECKRRVASLEHLGTHDSVAYTLLDRDHLARLRAYGCRSFGTPDEVVGITLFRHDGLLSQRAAKLVPDGLVLARVPLRAAEKPTLFGRRSSVRLTRRHVSVLNAGMGDRVEILDEEGWL